MEPSYSSVSFTLSYNVTDVELLGQRILNIFKTLCCPLESFSQS